MKTKIFLIITFISFWITGISQTVTGGVFEHSDEGHQALVGATVLQLNTTNGATTASDGHFTLELEKHNSHKLVVSYVSYENDTINLNKTGYEHVHIMLENNRHLDEVEIKERGAGSHVSRTDTRHVYSINENELQKAACCNLSESFETSADVDVSYSDAVTGAKQIQMLGLAGIYTQMLTENMPNMRGLATPWGLGYIPGSWMQSIQVSKGTSSVINGYESMAGQINVEYKKADEGEKFFINAYGNQMGKMEGNMNTRFQVSEKISTAILAHVETMNIKHDDNDDSFMDMPLVSQINLFNRWRFVGKNLRSRIGFKYLSERRQGGQLSYDPDKANTTDNGYGIEINTNRYEGFWKIGYVLPQRHATSFGFQNQVIYHDQESIFGLNNYDATQLSYYGNLMFQSWFSDPRHQYTIGVSYNYDYYDENLNDSLFTREESVPGVMAQYTFSNKENLSIIAGMRVDEHNLYGTLLTPRIHAKYDINEHNTVRASAGRGYRSPNVIAENMTLLASSRKFNILQTPDIESSWNFGLSYTRYLHINEKELTLTADFFRTNFENQVIIDQEENADMIYVYNLDGKSYSNSLQIEAAYELFKNFDVTMAFRYNDVQTTISDNLVEKPLVSKYKGLVALSYQTEKRTWQFDVNMQAIGNQRLPYTGYYPTEYQLGEYSPDYLIFNSQVTRYLGKFEIYLGGENLGNYKQEDPIIASNDPFGEYFDSSIIWGPITGIKVYAGVRFKVE